MGQKFKENKVLKNAQIKKYFESLSILNQSTEDYLFLLDIKNNENWFFGDISKKYKLYDSGETTNTIEEMFEIVHKNDQERLLLDLNKIADGTSKEHNMTYRWIDKNEKTVWINCRGRVIDDEKGNPMVMIGRVNDTGLLHCTNSLTGFFNSNKLLEDLKAGLSKVDGYLFLVGIDNLGKINMKYGRDIGDEYISYLGETVEAINGINYLYHLDSNVFGIYLENSTEKDVYKLFNKIQNSVKEKFNITGVAVANSEGYFLAESDLYRTAMSTIIKAKKNNRCELTFYSKEDAEKNKALIEISSEMGRSIRNNYEGFYIVYQPQINANRYNLYGVEALLRFKSEKYGNVYPDEFIPLLEQTNLIKEVGYWVLKESLEQLKTWRKVFKDLHLNVNFSLVQLEDDEVTNEVARIFTKSQLPPNSLTIEITESIKVEEITKFNRALKVWKSIGIEIAIDDFGTGYSNLGMLKKYDFDEIKIDRLFITGIKEETYDYILINNIIDFAKSNSIRICCEGVESEKELSVLSKLNPDYYQGYLFSKPCTVEEFENCYINKDSELYQEKLSQATRLNSKKLGSMIQFNPKDVLDAVDVGLWIIRIDQITGIHELHVDEIVEHALEMNKNFNSKECFDYWYNNIDKTYIDYVDESFSKIIKTDKVILVRFLWHHPTKGDIYLSWSGIRVKDKDGMIYIRGLHRIMSDIEESRYIETTKRIESYLLQNKRRYIDVIMANSIGFLEVDLTNNVILGDIVSLFGGKKVFPIERDVIVNENNELDYSKFEKWWAERYITSNKEEFIKKTSVEYLLDAYKKGQNVLDIYCSLKIGKNSFDCKESYFMYEDEFNGNIHAFSIVYDMTEENKQKQEASHKNTIIQKLSDEYNAICYVDLESGLMKDYRTDEIWVGWECEEKDTYDYNERVNEFANSLVYIKEREKFINNLSIENLKNVLSINSVYSFEYRVLKDDVPIHYLTKVVLDETVTGKTCVIIGFKNIEKEKNLQHQLQKALELAYTDQVTSLLNQQGLLDKANNLLLDEMKKSALLFMDIDNFKEVNDTYGHAAGDELLESVGKVLRENTRKADLVGRYGGDEFVVLIYDIPNNDVAIRKAEKICESIRNIKLNDNIDHVITVSVGVSFTTEVGYNYRLLKDLADDRLYVAKKSGKNKIVSK